MRHLAILVLAATAIVVAGCGGMPKPQIEAQKPRADATLVRVSMSATNYDDSWDKEKVRLRIQQVWLNRDGVPTNKEVVLDHPYEGRPGSNRGTLKMKDNEGRSTNRVRLTFELVSGENAQNENISGSTTLEWKLSSYFNNKDVILLPVISRKARNNYQIDVLYAMDPVTGEIEQVLPSYDAR